MLPKYKHAMPGTQEKDCVGQKEKGLFQRVSFANQ